MAEETAYFNYILSKCSRARISGALPAAFKDVEELISAYRMAYYGDFRDKEIS